MTPSPRKLALPLFYASAIAMMLTCTCFAADETEKAVQKDQDKFGVAEKLRAFEYEVDTLDDLTLKGGVSLRQQIIRYYTNNPSAVSLKSTLVVSRCFALEHDFEAASRLSEGYVKVYTNDYRGWRVLAGAYALLDRNALAVEAYERVVALGDEASLSSLAAASVEARRWDVLRRIMPRLMTQKLSDEVSKSDRLQITGALCAYAIEMGDDSIFSKALEGETAEDILSRQDLARLVRRACESLRADKKDSICEKVRQGLAPKPDAAGQQP